MRELSFRCDVSELKVSSGSKDILGPVLGPNLYQLPGVDLDSARHLGSVDLPTSIMHDAFYLKSNWICDSGTKWNHKMATLQYFKYIYL
ncbi:unnamed protein product [Leptosia nina]|uniref:Uncharacterized protein n=1 Tax=Leptosia nina TaxID=320188 RepID=A0AAV1JTE4_9NEOP